ncbi:GntR family transcriptional regulator [Acidaminobacter sp. JC074]|uniref:GntR family transcriptional regulator n=1 Tax=Acidaminobacter sp. JC074 TaxID=2530199 RepID=UPI001F102071|nr:GntR family transcriptional regulator [Acidaminobacter sp. JC074]MCH4886321.1 GntR family transcriptional regulator [Acidaminobacter sp. JC074]
MKKIIKKTITDQIYEILREEIINQEITSGTRLLFTELQKKYNISSSPLREAMNRLYQDGLVTYYSNKGAQVVTFTEEDIHEIYNLYCELDCLAVKYAMNTTMYDEMLNEIKENVEETRSLLKGDPQAFNDSSDDFHILVYKYAANKRLTYMANQLRSQFTILSNIFENEDENRQLTLNNHEKIYESFVNKDMASAMNLIRENFENSKQFVLKLYNET